ncbi:Uncharacterised protein [Segatella copri]|nr:Uncharacterised protein [Segatella copri]
MPSFSANMSASGTIPLAHTRFAAFSMVPL